MKQERTRKTPNVWQACVILVCVIAAVVAAIKTGVGMVDKILSRSPINFLQAAERCSAACDYPKGLSLRASRRLARQSVFPVPDTQEFSGRTESSAPTVGQQGKTCRGRVLPGPKTTEWRAMPKDAGGDLRRLFCANSTIYYSIEII